MRLTVAHSDRERTVFIPVDDATTVAQLSTALGVDPVIVGGVRQEDASLVPIAETALLSGAVIPARTAEAPPEGTPRLEVIGGPFSGQSISLSGVDQFIVGSGPDAHLRIADPHLEDAHVRVVVGASALGVTAEAGRLLPLLAAIEPSPGAPVRVNGTLVEGHTQIKPVDVIQLGSSLLRIGMEPASDADVAPDPQGMRAFNRPSRIRLNEAAPTVTLPGERPEDSDKSPLPWLSAVIPVVLGVTMATVFNRPIMLLMAAASPLMVVGSYLVNRKLAKKKGERTEAQWIDEVKQARKRIAELVRSQRVNAWYDNPDPLRIKDIALRPLSRLWERRHSDPDALVCRIGAGELSLNAQFQGGPRSDLDVEVGVSPVPVSVNLSSGPVGIGGCTEAVRSVARSMIASFATLRSPRDLRLVVLCDEGSEREWGWISWLPHVTPDSGPAAMIGNTDDTRRDRLRELASIVEHRRRAGQDVSVAEHIVVLIDGARSVRRLPGMIDVLAGGTAVGVHVVALDSDRSRLPEECRTLVLFDDADNAMARLEAENEFVPRVLVDGLSLTDVNEIARSLCSIDHVSGVGDEGTLPTSVRYVDVTGIDTASSESLLQRWNTTPRRSFVTVGATAESEFAIDLAKDGPHALVAGTTGSGKSEFLQTLVVSLALANRPDAMNFVLVDYKGGSAFADCERLPHTVGMVTNLDARETERALASLDAELKRRERLLAEMGAKDLDSAWERDPDTASRNGLARLVMVIDEFAELKAELPEFINGIVRIARVGRSLGVHLVLATQRPSGVVTPEMQSNINLRVSLRVTDRADSSDILGAPDAAWIPPSLPGRGFVRSAIGGHPVPFQTARVACLKRGAQQTTVDVLPVAELSWDRIGSAPQFPPEHETQAPIDHDDTDLRALVGLAIDAARLGGIERSPSPWLRPLPEILPIDRFLADPIGEGEILLGLQDLPKQQTQCPLVWNPTEEGHLLFIGGARSGRTTALRTILAQAVVRHSPSDLHLYIADYGNGALLPLTGAPHCGAVISPGDHERLPRLMERLLSDLARRQASLSVAGVGSIAEQRKQASSEDALAYAVFAIDGWERLTGTFGADQLVVFREQIMRVLREGPAAGIRLILTADRTFTGDKIASAIDTQYLLPLRDPNDYRAAGIMIRELPTNLVPGRTLSGAEGKESQLALLSRDAGGEAQSAMLRQYIDSSRDYYRQFAQLERLPIAFRVDPLPAYIGLQHAFTLPVHHGLTPEGLVYGVGGDELSRVTVDWSELTGFVAAGSRGSGRSTVLAALLHQLHAAGQPVIVVAPRASVLTELAEAEGIGVINDIAVDAVTFTSILDELEPKHGSSRVTLVLDDAEMMKQQPIEFAITGVTGRVSIAVAVESEAASSLFGGALAQAKRHRKGIVLTPTHSMVGMTLFGTQIPKFMIGSRSVGSGVAHIDGLWIPIRTPDVRQ
ncbi:MAG: FtsK/SpoIIIE domain-containing protein [Leucobacter sp.]